MEKNSNIKALSEDVLNDFARNLKYLYDKYSLLEERHNVNMEEKDEKSCVS